MIKSYYNRKESDPLFKAWYDKLFRPERFETVEEILELKNKKPESDSEKEDIQFSIKTKEKYLSKSFGIV